MNEQTLTDDLQKTEFEIGGTTFYVSKLPSMKAYNLLERIRKELGQSALDVVPERTGDGNAAAIAAMQMVLSLAPEFVESIRVELFRSVEFHNDRNQRQGLEGAEDFAFGDLEPIAVYEVLVRCLAVNFSASLLKLDSSLLGLGLSGSQ